MELSRCSSSSLWRHRTSETSGSDSQRPRQLKSNGTGHESKLDILQHSSTSYILDPFRSSRATASQEKDIMTPVIVGGGCKTQHKETGRRQSQGYGTQGRRGGKDRGPGMQGPGPRIASPCPICIRTWLGVGERRRRLICRGCRGTQWMTCRRLRDDNQQGCSCSSPPA